MTALSSEKDLIEPGAVQGMPTGRLEAFSDGVIAILITIMILELRVPRGAGWAAVRSLLPVLSIYMLSFVNLGIYWNNHHHLLHAAQRINGKILWANLHLLFWLSLVPFATKWMGENHFVSLPIAAYGVVMFLAGLGFLVLVRAIIAEEGAGSKLAVALGRDLKGKLSAACYVVAIPLAFLNRWIAIGIYIVVALIWFVPDRRIERL